MDAELWESIRDSLSSDLTEEQKAKKLSYLADALHNQLSSKEPLAVSGALAKAVYLAKKRELPDPVLNLYLALKRAQAGTHGLSEHKYLSLWLYCLCQLGHYYLQLPIPKDLAEKIEGVDTEVQLQHAAEEESHYRVQVWKKGKDNSLSCSSLRNNEQSIRLVLKEDQSYLGQEIWKGAVLQLIDYKHLSEDTVEANHIIVDPDYLLNVSIIANCFGNESSNFEIHFWKKLVPTESSPALNLGNVVNFLLDRLIELYPEKPAFRDLFKEVFAEIPFALVSYSDEQVKQLLLDAESHFRQLQKVVYEVLEKEQIALENCHCEPSYYSVKYGLMGRLDVLHENEEHKKTDIIELKSSAKVPHGNALWLGHKVQTLLYKLLIEEVYPYNRYGRNFILYSTERNNTQPLRYQDINQDEIRHALHLRNHIVFHEFLLAKLAPLDIKAKFLDIMTQERLLNHPKITQYNVVDARKLKQMLQGMSDLELSYYQHALSFVAREHRTARLGGGSEGRTGMSGLWQDSPEDKKQNFVLLDRLLFSRLEEQERSQVLVFSREEGLELFSFREAESCILYPEKKGQSVLQSRLIKVNLHSISENEIRFSLKHKVPSSYFEKESGFWNLEADLFDASYAQMYHSLFQFFSGPANRRSLCLGLKAPEASTLKTREFPELSPSQQGLLNKLLSSPDYFLVIGPPGTGKTKIILKNFVCERSKELVQNEKILLLAFTNRAVDEMCEAMLEAHQEGKIGSSLPFLRIGSSQDQRFKPYIIRNIAKQAKSRAELKEQLNASQIYCSTLSSISSQQELFQLVKFDTLVVDEATQLLEPQLLGILQQVKRFVLIGDDKQLSAVVLQSTEVSDIEGDSLKPIALRSFRESLFERLLRLAKRENWQHCYAQLNEQGRMHQELLAFPNQTFYESQLQTCMPWQEQTLSEEEIPCNKLSLSEITKDKRLCLFDIPYKGSSDKINEAEAEAIVSTIQELYAQYQAQGIELQESNIGIIAPYKAQIALIKRKLKEANPLFSLFTVDTVERYQGGQRDCILYSFCLNSLHQLSLVQVLNEEKTVDRKLNVALTRAKQKLYLFGNLSLLRKNAIFTQLADFLEGKGLLSSHFIHEPSQVISGI